MPRFDRAAIIHASLAAFALALVVKAAQVQLWQHDRWTERASKQHFRDASLPAPRGVVTDATGRVLVESRELVQLRVAPKEVKDLKRLGRLLAAAGVPTVWVARATDADRAWVELPGRFLPTDVASITATRGVHPEPVMERVFSASEGVRRIVGRVDGAGDPVDGVELALDSVLRGARGVATVLRDARGRPIASPAARAVAAKPGHTVTLTINFALQDIAARALGDATKRMSASGGDIVVHDPKSGEVHAMASHRADRRSTASTALSEPFEPGSTLKPFMAAAVLARGRARTDEVVSTENGQWTIHGRTITDIHKASTMSLKEVIQESSNIGIVKFASRLQPREQYEALRDLGFGMATGVPYPAEASGTLRPPLRWSKQSPASLAMGYELAVTPLQLAAAYAAIANGGELLEPSLVKEVRTPEGEVRYRHGRRVIRRVMPPRVAADVRDMLKSVVDSGTAMDADLASFAVGGKSGTARRTERGQGYVSGRYTATFVGLFPIDDPQYVILVKLDNPTGTYYGGKTAAPVSKVVLEAALAARDAALDRGSLAARTLPRARDAFHARDTTQMLAAAARAESSAAAVPVELRRADLADRVDPAPQHFIVELTAARRRATPTLPPRSVPTVQGLPLRDAVYVLHRAGFRVRLAPGAFTDGGPASRTAPAAGASLAAGSSVTLFREP